MSQGVRVLVSKRIHPLHNRGLSLTSYIQRSLFSPRALGMINWQSIGTRLMAAQLDVAGLLLPSERCAAETCVFVHLFIEYPKTITGHGFAGQVFVHVACCFVVLTCMPWFPISKIELAII